MGTRECGLKHSDWRWEYGLHVLHAIRDDCGVTIGLTPAPTFMLLMNKLIRQTFIPFERHINDGQNAHV